MAMIMNIAGATAIEDAEYRYKMPRIISKVEGRGNGIKTVIPNMLALALSLHRTPGEVTKFFGCELGAQTTWTEDTERAVVNGAHTEQALQDKLKVYIDKFVLCPSCKLPETSYKIKHEIINHQCVACGAREGVDMTHKLTTYILKCNKVEKDAKKKLTKDKDGKEGKKEKKEKKDKDVEETDEERAARKAKKAAKKAKKAAEEADDEEEEDDDDDNLVQLRGERGDSGAGGLEDEDEDEDIGGLDEDVLAAAAARARRMSAARVRRRRRATRAAASTRSCARTCARRRARRASRSTRS
mmetsp:Transcript_18442/g.63497  ORF Transcript_18442/g.63497 Transcript_18442/m.63497 type:complete len:299 (+) Transcript_18442:188-1084(+)